MKVLLSGPNGNLGQHIIKNADFQIIPVKRNDWNNLKDEDVRNSEAFIHLAYDLKKSITSVPDEVLDSNVLSTMKALRICKEKNIARFIFISSCSVYGYSSRSKEDQNCSPVTINGLVKYLCEKVIIEFCEANNMEYLILRVFNSYGGNDKFSVLSKLINSINSDEPFKLFNNGLAERDFIHIDDVAKVVCHYSKVPSSHRIVNVGTGKTTRIIDLLNTAESRFGKIQKDYCTDKNEVEYSRADTSRISSEIDINFTHILDFIKSAQITSSLKK